MFSLSDVLTVAIADITLGVRKRTYDTESYEAPIMGRNRYVVREVPVY
jgi:hypothetical protein